MSQFISENLGVNGQGHLTIGGADTVALAKEYGTPLYVMDEQKIRDTLRRFHESLDRFYHGRSLVCYASKAFSCKEMCRIVASEGDGLDVVSAGELYTAIKAGFPMEKVGDNLPELRRLEAVAEELDAIPDIMLRIKPGIDAHTHQFIMTGQIDSKFGFALETGEAFEAVKEAVSCGRVKLSGIHCHIGSQIFGIEPFEAAAGVMLDFAAKVKKELGYEIPGLNLGGGFGIKYLSSDDPEPFENYIERVAKVVKALYTVGARKEIPGIRTYVSVDGGMGDNPRYILYQSEYEAVSAERPLEERTEKVTIAGRCCESGDLIGENMPIQHVDSGDIIAVLATGAYNYSMSSNYNRVGKPAVVFVNNGESRIAVRRETLDDVIRNDV